MATVEILGRPGREPKSATVAARDNRELLQAVIETTPECIKVVAPDGRLLQMNSAGLEMIGAESWEAVDQAPVLDLIAPEHREDWRRGHDRVCQGESLSWEFDIVRFDGVHRHMQTHATPIRLADGSMGQLAITRDITTQRRLDQALQLRERSLEDMVSERTRELETALARLQQSEQSFELLVRSVTDYAIYMLDPEGNVASWNAGAERIKGYSEAEIIGQNFSRFYTDEDRLAGRPARGLKIAGTVGRFEAEGWRVRKDGSRFWASVVIDAIRDGGELIGFAKITRDISERKAAEERLYQAQKMEAVGQLTGGVAHDFNNLLAAIIPSLEMARAKVKDERVIRHLDTAAHAAARGAALTHQLLAFSRKQHLANRSVEVNRLIERLCEMLPRTLGPAVSIELDLEPAAWPAMTDPSQFELALLNLAINARDAMGPGGRLRISTRNVEAGETGAPEGLGPGRYLLICVADNGSGMTDEVRTRAFEPFFSTKMVGRGSGLGLSLVYGFARQSGGTAAIDSALGEGTTIRIYLPRAETEAVEEAARPGRSGLDAGPPSRILVVDDDDAVRGVICEMVRSFGHDVVAAKSGEEGLGLLQESGAFHLMVVDLAMPNMHGALFAVRARAIHPTTPVLFVTGYADANWSSEIEGDELMKKPFTEAEMAERLRLMLSGAAA